MYGRNVRDNEPAAVARPAVTQPVRAGDETDADQGDDDVDEDPVVEDWEDEAIRDYLTELLAIHAEPPRRAEGEQAQWGEQGNEDGGQVGLVIHLLQDLQEDGLTTLESSSVCLVVGKPDNRRVLNVAGMYMIALVMK